MPAEEKRVRPDLDYLSGELEHLYDEEAAVLAELEQHGRAQRARFKEAKNTLSATAGRSRRPKPKRTASPLASPPPSSRTIPRRSRR